MLKIAPWLEMFGLGKYAGVLIDQEINAEILSELTELDLEKLGLPIGYTSAR